jgi:HAD superfamily hydrolase (TIGR01509 family)
MNLPIPTSDRPFAGYIFDCDGTVADTMPLHYRAWAQTMTVLGGQFPEELHYAWGGMPNVAIVEKLNEMFGTFVDPAEAIRLKHQFYLELVHEVRPIQPVVNLVHRFKATAPVAIASGGRREIVLSTLSALNLVELFDVIVSADDYERGKPHPEPFLLAAKLMGVPPEDCLVFEDTPTGLQAAQAAGMQCVLVPSAQAHSTSDSV